MSKPTGHVLIVDDDSNLLSLCREALARDGFTSQGLLAADGVLPIIEAQHFDLVLLDLALPDTDGMIVLEQIRARDRELPIVLITGHATLEDVAQATRLGTQGMLLKPFTLTELRTVVADTLQQRRAEVTYARVATLRPLVEVSQRLLAELDPARLHGLIVETVCEEVQADRAALLLYQPDSETFILAATIGEPLDVHMGEALVMSAQQVALHVVANRKPLIVSQERRDPRTNRSVRGGLELMPEPMGSESLLMVPLLAGERALGVVQVARPPASLPFSEADQELVWLLAGQMALALENAQLYSLAQQRTERLDTLYRISASIAASLDLNTITAAVLEQIGDALPLEKVHLCLLDDAHPTTVQRRSWSRIQLTPLLSAAPPTPGSLLARVLADGVTGTERWRGTNGGAGHQDALCVVLRSEQKVCGAIEVVGQPEYHFDDEDQQFLVALAAPLALAIEKARLHAGIAASEERYRAVLEFANDAVLLLDSYDRRIIDANRSLEQLTGYERSALQKMPVGALFDHIWHNADGQHALDSVSSAHIPQRSDGIEALSTFETLLRTRGNLQVPVSIGISRVTYADEELLLLIVRDISEYQQATQQTVQAEKLAAVGRMAAAIAHEINNPLQAIYNSLHLLTKHPLNDEKRQRYLDMTFNEAEQLIGVVQRLIDFHRPSREGMRPAQVPDLLHTVLEQLAGKFEQAQVQIVRDWRESLPRVLLIQSHIKHVFVNLFLNAIDAMAAGGTLTIRIYHARTPSLSRIDGEGVGQAAQQIAKTVRAEMRGAGGQLIIEVSDTGHGIAPQELLKIFEPFYTTKMTGTGLGLAISYNIVQQHGGELTATSTPKQGTTFRVALPAAE